MYICTVQHYWSATSSTVHTYKLYNTTGQQHVVHLYVRLYWSVVQVVRMYCNTTGVATNAKCNWLSVLIEFNNIVVEYSCCW